MSSGTSISDVIFVMCIFYSYFFPRAVSSPFFPSHSFTFSPSHLLSATHLDRNPSTIYLLRLDQPFSSMGSVSISGGMVRLGEFDERDLEAVLSVAEEDWID